MPREWYLHVIMPTNILHYRQKVARECNEKLLLVIRGVRLNVFLCSANK
jgi:hypothetical protein